MTVLEHLAHDLTNSIAKRYQYFSLTERASIEQNIVRTFQPYMPEPQTALNFEQDQLANLDRVQSRLGTQILWFCKERINQKRREFYMDDLRDYLEETRIKFAPASPDRVLRHLRTVKMLDYRILNRRQSFYELISTIFSGDSHAKPAQ